MVSKGNGGDVYQADGRNADRISAFLVGLAALLCAAGLAYAVFGLGVRGLRNDPALYWRLSFELATPFNDWWVPLYPAAIALLRTITLGVLSPYATLALLSSTFYLAGVYVFDRILTELRVSDRLQLGMLYVAYPFIGVAYVVHPLSDGMMLTWLLLAYLAYLRRRWWALALWAALALLTHKLSWFYVPPLLALTFLEHPQARRVAPLAVVPLLAWLGVGAYVRQDLFWFIRSGYQGWFVSQTSLPLADGLLSPLFGATPIRAARGVVVLAVFLLAGALLIASLRARFWLGVAITLPAVLLGLILYRMTIWAEVRSSKVLMIPLAYFLSRSALCSRLAMLGTPFGFGLLWALCVASNFAFLYYTFMYRLTE